MMEQQSQLNDNKQKYPPMHISDESEAALNDLLQKVPRTAEILFYKRQNSNINIQWINWSIEMLEAGYETENLIILAGEDIHCNPFEFSALTDKIFNELQLEKIDLHHSLIMYSTYLIKQAIESPNEDKISDVLFRLEQLCIDNDYCSILYDFYLLSNAISELKDLDGQWYWNDITLTKENWYEYTLKCFEQWINTPIQKKRTANRHDCNENVSITNSSKKSLFRKLISYFYR